ncbi:MAG: F0F1 ATP synthase subunit epsilon [Robiginitomaculum sp.]|nr:F0F1 ATP synthase subunit epsilon [Robiginitomaculum sp.]MDQ7077676.1 F0F1 ATP synthase subunit epsilon [Robiginitomaculum sp.]
MAAKLKFSLVSPEKELFSGEVDGVDVPGEEGDFGVLPNHAPVMTTIRMGTIAIKDGQDTRRMFLRGGFADVTPDGLIILAEEAVDIADLDAEKLSIDLRNAEEDLRDAKTDEKRAAASDRLEYVRGLSEALAS